jgi:hypothetical protein
MLRRRRFQSDVIVNGSSNRPFATELVLGAMSGINASDVIDGPGPQ